ncbi:MAG: hypothetical protein MUF54_17360, partial [Polyangiaceae bacterium]|nr:hypothetical protein [Polyangiaceae bacterium]
DAPAGKNVIEIPAQLGYDCGQQRYRDKSFEEYKPYKEEMGMATVRRAEALLPGLRDHIEVFEVGMPRTMHGFTFNPRGTIFGWDSVISQTMMSRMGADRLGASTTCTLQAPGASLAEGNPPSFSPAPGRRPRFSLSSPDRGTRQDELCPPRTSPATDQPGSIAMADGLATTSLVLGEREALSMLERTPDVEGLLLVEEEGRGRRLMGTNGFDAKILHEV